MKHICRTLFVLGWLGAAVFFAGCASPGDSFFSESSGAPAAPTAQVSAKSATTKADPQTNLPPSVALFQVGDTVTVTFSGLPVALDPHTEPIKEDGTIDLPDIGKVQAAGKTAGQLQNDIHDLYVPSIYRHLTVAVTTGDRVYYVRGEVKNPGRQLYIGETTVTRAIASAGDFTDFANHHNVLLIRANGQQVKVNCSKVVDGKIPDPIVYPGDQIVVRRRLF